MPENNLPQGSAELRGGRQNKSNISLGLKLGELGFPSVFKLFSRARSWYREQISVRPQPDKAFLSAKPCVTLR